MTVTMIEASVTLFVTSCVFCSIAAACDATSWRNNSAESPCYENATVISDDTRAVSGIVCHPKAHLNVKQVGEHAVAVCSCDSKIDGG